MRRKLRTTVQLVVEILCVIITYSKYQLIKLERTSNSNLKRAEVKDISKYSLSHQSIQDPIENARHLGRFKVL